MTETEYRRPKRGSAVVRTIVVIAVLAVLAAVGLFAWKYMFSGPMENDEQSKRYDEKISRLEVRGNAGDVEIVAGDGDEVTVDASLEWRGSDKPTARQELDGDTLKVSEEGCDGFDLMGFVSCQIRFRIEVPADTKVDAEVDSGNLSVSGVTADQKLTCDSGNVDVDGSGEKLTVIADSGNLSGRNIKATTVKAQVDSGNMDMTFDSAPELVDASVDSADLTLTLPKDDEPYDVNVTVGSGDKSVDVKTSGNATRKINGGVDSGDLTVRYA